MFKYLKYTLLCSVALTFCIFLNFIIGYHNYYNNYHWNCDEENESDSEVTKYPREFLYWYFESGLIRPEPKNHTDIWPDEAEGDRITNQLMYVPTDIPLNFKTIYAEYVEYLDPKPKPGRQEFEELQCPVNKCLLVTDRKTADMVFYKNKVHHVGNADVPLNQIWVHFVLESPIHAGVSKHVNWTVTYRSDSDVPFPYGKWLYYNENIKTIPQTKNYASQKFKKVAWFVSNCNPKNHRKQYAQELKKFINVDIYGNCGDFVCPRTESGKCLKMLKTDYKFYLAFENSNCREYITEKFFNALQQDVIPIVMGAHPRDYEKVAPYNSYIHVDHFRSPKELADYLHALDKNDSLYNSYFQWKGTGEFINTRLFCRLCAMLHSNRTNKIYENYMQDWWYKPGICIKGSWI